MKNEGDANKLLQEEPIKKQLSFKEPQTELKELSIELKSKPRQSLKNQNSFKSLEKRSSIDSLRFIYVNNGNKL